MKTKTLFTLYAIAIALAVGVFIAKLVQNAEEDSSTQFTRGYKPFENLSPGEIAEIHLKGADNATTIKIADGKWVVAERENYPVNLDSLQSLIRKMKDLTVAQALEAGESFNPRFGMDEKSSDPDTHGSVLTLKTADGKEITRMNIGKEIASASQDPMAAMMGGGNTASGKYVRLKPDPDSVYVVNDALSEAKTHPKDWLVKDFIKVQNITSVSLSPEGKPGQTAWKVSRANSTGDFTVEGGIPAGKELNTGTVNPLKNILGYPNFEDVVSAEAAKGLQGNAKSRRAIITTADGFTYTLDIAPKEAKGTEKYLMKVEVSAQLKTERDKPAEESEEAAKTAEEAFQAALKANQEKLAQEQALKGRVFEVTSYTVQALLKSKDDLLQDKAAPAAAGGAPAGAPSFNPGSVTTPPFQIPNQ